MATLQITIVKAKVLKNGQHKIRIAIRHKHETRYIVTRYTIDDEAHFKNGQVIKTPDASVVNLRLRNMLNELQEILDNVKHISMYSCKQLKDILEQKNVDIDQILTYQKASENYISDLLHQNRTNYAKMMERSCRYFTEFCRGPIPIADITPNVIESFTEFLKCRKKVSNATVGMMQSHIKAVINKNISLGNVKYDIHPFAKTKISKAKVRDCDISLVALNAIKNFQPETRGLQVAKDAFMLSFYLGGINLVDMLEADFTKNPVSFIRKKTQLRTGDCVVSIPVVPEAQEIINRWIDPITNKINFRYSFSYHNLSAYISRQIQALSRQANINEYVIFYSARKTFAQIAFELGIPESIIDYCLGHSGNNRGIIRYYTKAKIKQAEIAITRVVDYINNPDKYKDFLEMRSDIMMMKVD